MRYHATDRNSLLILSRYSIADHKQSCSQPLSRNDHEELIWTVYSSQSRAYSNVSNASRLLDSDCAVVQLYQTPAIVLFYNIIIAF